MVTVRLRRWSLAIAALAGLVGAQGCALEEIQVASGESMLVVQAVMRPDRNLQYVVVERSFSGETVIDEFGAGNIPPNVPQIPVSGASVRILNLDFVDDPCANFAELKEVNLVAGVYATRLNCPTMRVGDRLELTVLTVDGEEVRGMTRIPGIDAAWVRTVGDSIMLEGADSMTFNRDTDTLWFEMETQAARLMQVEVQRLDIFGAPHRTDGFGLTRIFVDSTAVTLPGGLLNVFEGGEGDEVFRAGRHYRLTVAATDTNFFDFARSRNNRTTGRGFINRLTGGVGVFGSLVATGIHITAIGEMDDPREGVYRLEGVVQGVTIDALLTVYLRRQLQDTEFSAFLEGDWLAWVLGVWVSSNSPPFNVDGEFAGEEMTTTSRLFRTEPIRGATLEGVRSPDAPFDLELWWNNGITLRLLGTVTATQQ